MKVNLQNWKDNGGCLPALDAGGRRFEMQGIREYLYENG